MFRTVIFEFAGEEKPIPVSHVSSAEHVRLIVAASFWKVPLPLSFVLKYRDEDGDLITLESADDWREMLAHVAQPRVSILARAPATAASPCATPAASAAAPATPTPAAAAPGSLSAIGAQVVPVGSRFRQRWVLRNTGAVAWPAGCRVVHQRGELLGCFPSFVVPSAAPGAAVSIEVNFTAPRTVGVYESFWLLVTPRGEPLGDIVRVLVSAVQPTSTPVFPGLRLGEVYNVFPGLPSAQPAAAASSSPAAINLLAHAVASTPAPASVVRDVLAPGARFSRRWTLRNETSAAWPEGVRARRTTGCHSFGFFDSFLVPALAPGAETTLDLTLVAPNVVGDLDATWELQRPDGSRIPGVALRLHLSLQRSATNSAFANSSSSSSSSSSRAAASPTKRNDRHPLLAKISSLSEAELDKLCNAFVNL